MHLKDQEIVLCIAALDNAIKDLTEGMAASIRMNRPLPSLVNTTIHEMRNLRIKLLMEGDYYGQQQRPDSNPREPESQSQEAGTKGD